MTPSKRMKPVAKLARRRAHEAARDYAEGHHNLVQQQAQLEELLAYRDEYGRRLQELENEGMNAMQIRDFNLFLTRLNQAIEKQKVVLENARIDLQNSRKVWLDKQCRAKVVDKVVSRHQHREEHERIRKEQLESDERAQRTGDRKVG